MTSSRDNEVERICQAALDRPRAERDAFVEAACAGDDALRREVESLLARADAASNFIETPAMAVAVGELAKTMRALDAGQHIGAYTIVAALGAGGMGEVYRARDTVLGRDVAIKILPPLFTSDPERLMRFEREARVLAALNHPNIATIHGIEHVAAPPGSGRVEVHALVLELVEGETLARRLEARRSLPLSYAFDIARQIAEALEAAHAKGIVHRDLKPANIKIRNDGIVKVLDFGLAKVGGAGRDAVTQSPTRSLGDTREGVILGTAGYMSPEQARGLPIDRRADIWAFGCVLYEMLTGRAAFASETLADTLAAIIDHEPEWSAVPPSTPPAVRALLRRCLQKDPARRLRDIADARFQLEDVLIEPILDVGTATVPPHRTRERLVWVAALAAALATGAIASRWYAGPTSAPREVRLEITTPPTTDPASVAVSPDGRAIVFVATTDRTSRLWLRPLDAVSMRPLPGTDDASRPFWSPDSRSIGFFASGQLKRIDLDSGSVRALTSVFSALGGAWNDTGTILFSLGPGEGLFRIPATGGQPSVVTRPSVRANLLSSPQFFRDGDRFLYLADGTEPGIYTARLSAPETPRRILEAEAARYSPSGHLLFISQGALFAQRFDTDRQTLIGDPTAVAQGIAQVERAAPLSVSEAGPIVYRAGSPTEFAWFDRSGKRLMTVVGSDIGSGFNSSLSSDGRRLALTRNVGGNAADIWLLDLDRGGASKLTSYELFDLMPVWSPDDTRIAFSSNRQQPDRMTSFDVFEKSLTDAGTERLLVAHELGDQPTDWSRDGRFILYNREIALGNDDVWALPMEGDRRPFPVVNTRFDETSAQFSPDGRWIAFQSKETGRSEIYVQRFSGPAAKTLVSRDGGVQVRWRHDGREIFFLGLDGRLMAVPIRLTPSDATVGAPLALFAPRIGGQWLHAYGRNYMVAPDGRFLVETLKEVTIPITIILNWRPTP